MVSYLSSRQYQVNQDLQLGISATWRLDLGYIDGRARDLAGYDGIVRVGSAQEQMPSFGTAEHGSKNWFFCCYLLINFSTLANTQSPWT